MQHIALIVDDDYNSLHFLEQILLPTSLEVLLAEDGNQAINILRQTAPSVLFLDMLLPQVDGFAVLSFILQSPHLNDLFVAIVTAHNHFAPSPELDRADAYLVKPIRAKEIRDIAQRAIARQAAG